MAAISSTTQKVDARHLQPFGDALYRLERRISLAPFERSNVCAVHPEEFSECLLRKPALLTHPSQVVAEYRLKIAFHLRTIINCYLSVYRPISSRVRYS